jgi:hypothetical protein
MNAAWNSIKANRKLLLCLAALLALALILLFVSASQSPLRVFAIGTNEAAGARWVDIAITNSSARTYAIDPHTEVMLGGNWKASSSVRSPRQRTMPPDAFFTGNLLPGRESITYGFETPSESAHWRVRFFCFRKESAREQKMRQWFRRVGLKSDSLSEHVIEFGK